MDPFGTAGYVAMTKFLGGCCSCRKYILGCTTLLHEVRDANDKRRGIFNGIDGRMYDIYQDHSKSGYIDANGTPKWK